MNCLPIDESCMIRNQIEDVLYQPADDFYVNHDSFSLGEFNGREYTYTRIGGMPAIMIKRINKDSEEDALALDVLVSNYTNDF